MQRGLFGGFANAALRSAPCPPLAVLGRNDTWGVFVRLVLLSRRWRFGLVLSGFLFPAFAGTSFAGMTVRGGDGRGAAFQLIIDNWYRKDLPK